MKLFPKLALAISTLVMGTTAALSVSFYVTERRSIRLEAAKERRALLQNLVHITQESFLTEDDLLLVKHTRWLQQWNPALVSASVVSPAGEILAHSEPSRIGTTAAEPTSESPSPTLVLTQPVRLGDSWVATASAGFSEQHFEEAIAQRLHSLKRRLGAIAASAVAAGLVISFLLAMSWIRPIGALAQAARQVGQGTYGCDLTRTSCRSDELGFLSKSFQTMARDLEELDHMKEDFVSAVTHELRSPLGAIESYLNLMSDEMREGISPSSWQTYMERLRINTQRLTRFVNDLLDVAALERGKVTLDRQRVHVEHLIDEVRVFFAPKLSERKLDCKAVLSETSTPAAWADPDKVRQVLMNLLANAIKFTPEGGTIEIGVLAAPPEKELRIYVKDSGVGIAEKDRIKIFNKFEQVHFARKHVKGPKGTGLGLSVCRALVELHGGRLEVESRLGEGSCFTFTLPVAAE